MMKNTPHGRPSRRRAFERGAGMVELLIVMAIVTITTVIALPNFLKILRTSQLSDGATRMADILKQTRFQAIRRNTSITCRMAQTVLPPENRVYVDSDGSTTYTAGELSTVYSGNVNLVAAAGIPGTVSLATAIGANVVLTPVSPTAGTFTFDARGAVNPAAVYVVYVAYNNMPSLGYRAVVLLPSGSVQIWTGDSTGSWHVVS